MKKKILSLVLTVCMVLSLLPALSLPAAAGAQTEYYIGETYIGCWNNFDGYMITASVAGDGWTWTYVAAANSENAGTGTLTLTDAYIRGADSSGRSYGAHLPADTTIVLNGDSTIASGTGSGYCVAVCCDGALTIKDGDTDGTGSLSAVGGESSNDDSMGLEVNDTLTINSSRVTGLGGTAYNSSYGIYAQTLIVSGSADVTGIAGTANGSESNIKSCGVYCNSSANIIKAIITAELPMDLEKKGLQSYQGDLYVRFLGFGNGSLKALYDRSEGFFRRQIILTVRKKPPDRADDPFLAEKMCAEADGIFLWCLEGLRRLMENDFQFTISRKAQENMDAAVSEGNNVVDFMASEGYIRLKADMEASSRELYAVYRLWCEDNALNALSAKSFSAYLIENADRYNLEPSNNVYIGGNKRARGFAGIEILQRPCY